MKPRVIACLQQKGGVGKTASCSALGRCLAEKGKRVLMIDLDPQMNLSFINGVNVQNVPYTISMVWDGKASIQDAVQPVILPNLDIITGGLSLASADMQYSGRMGREKLLEVALEPIRNQYDYILIDCPPYLGLLTMAAATAATEIIIPTTCDVLAIQGLSQLWGFIQNIHKYCNTSLQVSGILLTMYDKTLLTTKGLENQIETAAITAGTKVYNTRIRYSQAIQTAQARRDTSIYGKVRVNAIADYMSFADEVIEEERKANE